MLSKGARICLICMWLILFAIKICGAESPYVSGGYVGSFGAFNSVIGAEWFQTSPYGYRTEPRNAFHKGIDIGAEEGTILRALGPGTVTEKRIDYGGYGLFITINYPWAKTPDGSDGGMDVLYAHLSGARVSEGDTVQAGQEVAYVGGGGDDPYAGYSTGDHLHLGVYYGNSNQDIDPALYFTDLSAGASGNGDGSGYGYGDTMDRLPFIDFELKADFAKPARNIIEALVNAATSGLNLIKDGVNRLFMILITIDLALGCMFMALSPDSRANFFSYFVYKFLFYGFLMFLLLHWGEYIGNFSKNFFVETSGVMMTATPEKIAAAISDPTKLIEKGMNIVTPLVTQILNDDGIGILIPGASWLGLIFFFLIMICFFIIGWHLALAYLEFYLMVLFGFTTFMFAGEKHTRGFAENGINGIVASAINLMFFCMFAVMLQGVMENTTVDAIYTVKTESGTEKTYHPNASGSDPMNGGIPPEEEGLALFMAKVRTVESYGGEYFIYCRVPGCNPETYGAYQVLNSANWNQWAEEYIADDNNPPLDTDFDLVPKNIEEKPPAGYRYPATARNQDLICGHKMLRLYNDFGNWKDVAEFWGGDKSGEYWSDICGAAVSGTAHIPIVRRMVNMAVLGKLLLVVLMFMLMSDRIGKLILKSFGGKGFTFRTNY